MVLPIQLFEMVNRKMVTTVSVRGMGSGKSMKARKWLERGMWKRKETGMGREIGIQTGVEMGMIEERM